MKIGDIKLKGRLFVAPMVNISDLAFRLECQKYGAALTYSEMIVVNSLISQNKKILQDAMTVSKLKPDAIQLAGYDPKMFIRALPFCEPFDMIDINFGCPVSKAQVSGIGATLLQDPEKMKKIIEAVVKNTDKPVTAKVRLGFKKNNIFELTDRK